MSKLSLPTRKLARIKTRGYHNMEVAEVSFWQQWVCSPSSQTRGPANVKWREGTRQHQRRENTEALCTWLRRHSQEDTPDIADLWGGIHLEVLTHFQCVHHDAGPRAPQLLCVYSLTWLGCMLFTASTWVLFQSTDELLSQPTVFSLKKTPWKPSRNGYHRQFGCTDWNFCWLLFSLDGIQYTFPLQLVECFYFEDLSRCFMSCFLSFFNFHLASRFHGSCFSLFFSYIICLSSSSAAPSVLLLPRPAARPPS